MTGGNATLGTSAANGAKLAFKEINANGGVLGKQIEAVVADNKSEPAEAANAITKLINQDKVCLLYTSIVYQNINTTIFIDRKIY